MKPTDATRSYEQSEPVNLATDLEDSRLGDPLDTFLRRATSIDDARDSTRLIGPMQTAAMAVFQPSRFPMHHGHRAATAFEFLGRYGLPCSPLERPDSWAVAVGPYALHLDAYTACRIARTTENTFAIAGRPYPVADHDHAAGLRGWAIRVALHLESAGDPVDSCTPLQPEQIVSLEAQLAEARRA